MQLRWMDPRDFGFRGHLRKGRGAREGWTGTPRSTADTRKPGGTGPCLDIPGSSSFISEGAGVRRPNRPTPEADP